MYVQFARFSGPTWEDLGTELEIDRRNLKQSLLFLFFTLFYPFLFVPFRNLILLVLWEIFEALTGNPFQNSFMILKRAWHGFVCSTNCQCASFDWTQTGVPIDVECESFLLNKWTKKKKSVSLGCPKRHFFHHFHVDTTFSPTDQTLGFLFDSIIKQFLERLVVYRN